MSFACSRPVRRTLAAVTTATLVLFSGIATATPAAAATSSSSSSFLAPVSPELATAFATLPNSTPYGAYVNVRGGTAAARADLLIDHGLNVVEDFPSIGVVYGTGSLGAIETLRSAPEVSYLSTDSALTVLDDSSGWATRVEQVQRAMGNGPYRDAANRILDGAGVGVAVVDSGVDGTHPDLASRVVRNTKYKCTSFPLVPPCIGTIVKQPLANTDPSSGHGSHVAGIVAGDGTASKGTFRGVAPGASLYGFSVGDGDSIWTSEVASAYQDILTGNAAGTNTPPIRIVTNSWGNGAGSAYNSNDVISLLVKQLVASGVTVLFAAGNGDATNNGGTGADDRLSSTAKDPTPGVITVANYNDAGTGTRNGSLDSSSSRGRKGFPNNYPDISAPGSSITSTCRAFQAVCAVAAPEWAPNYSSLSGTSMSTPHVAGIVALLLQARPTLTPTQIENLLQTTAYKFGDASTYEADPQNPAGSISFDKGAGLADAQAALDALGVAHDGGESGQGVPAVAISSPADGAVNDGTAPLTVTGTAADGYVAPKPFVSQVIASGDGGDFPSPVPGAVDLTSLSVLETPTGLRYTLGVRNLAEALASGNEYTLRQVVSGVAYATDITWDGTTAKASTSTTASFNNAPATDVTADRGSNTISFSVPWAKLGTPGAMTPAIKVVLWSYAQLSADFAPGSSAASSTIKPEYGAYTIRRPSLAGPPATTVTLAVDGGTATAQVLSGASPSYTWGTSVATTGLADGTHTLTATVSTDGVAQATRTVAFTVQRPVIVTSNVAVTSPADGATVDRVVVPVAGTSTSNAPAAQVRAVTVQITGAGFDSGPLTATGTDTWSLPFDFGSVVGGSYVLTAQFTLDGVVAATSSRTVLVPAAPVLISCAPRALTFWQNQFNGSAKAIFTTVEANALADKAVALSNGYFGSRSALVNVLYAKGKLPPETSAARQYAPLLLNLAAGQLSATMSTQLGLSGKEKLDASVYDAQRLGTTVSSAATWIRSQFPTGDLATAEQAAINLNNRVGITC